MREKVLTLNFMEMLRILDAKNADMGLKKMLLATDSSCTVDNLQLLMNELVDGNSQGPA